MTSGGAGERGPIQGIPAESEKKIQDEMEELRQLLRTGTSPKPAGEEKGEEKVRDVGVQYFEKVRHLQQDIRRLDSSQVYRTFRLVGTDYIVKDQRDGKGLSDKEKNATDVLRDWIVQKGKVVEKETKEYENYLSDPMSRLQTVEQRASQDRLNRMLSDFETKLLERFEKGGKFERGLTHNESSFLKKTMDQWKSFFDRFVSRTVRRSASWNELQSVVFRDLVRGKNATLVSDLLFQSGKTDKFTRLVLPQNAQNLLLKLAQMDPGSLLQIAQLAEGTAQAELHYLGIQSADGPVWGAAKAPTKGQFLQTAKAEERAAEALGLPLADQLRAKTRVMREGKRRSGGAFGGLMGEEGEDGTKGMFVPWFSSDRTKPDGKRKWFVPVAFSVILVLLGILLWAFVRLMH